MKVQVKVFSGLFVLAMLACAPGAEAKDRCEGWTHRGYPVSFQSCSYEDGKSGYYVVENNGTRPATVCWTINFSDGRKSDGCHSHLGAGESSSGSCFRCGTKNTGVDSFTLRKYEVDR